MRSHNINNQMFNSQNTRVTQDNWQDVKTKTTTESKTADMSLAKQRGREQIVQPCTMIVKTYTTFSVLCESASCKISKQEMCLHIIYRTGIHGTDYYMVTVYVLLCRRNAVERQEVKLSNKDKDLMYMEKVL